MPNDTVVFLGPTLSKAEAAKILDATYLPPAEQGSFVRAMRMFQPRVIVLIDGAFGKVPAVRHKEILWAIARGVQVFGVGSMGALRAAELAAFGMQGHGFVYRWYSLTPLADDDEVAVAMTPAELGAEPLSEALINMRLTLCRAKRFGIITSEQRGALEELARATHFVDRSYARLLSEGRSVLPLGSEVAMSRLASWLPSNAIDRKREDATGLLRKLAHRPGLMHRRPERLPFQLTEAWAYDLDAAGLWGDDIVSP